MPQVRRLAPSGQEKASPAYQYSSNSSSYQSGRPNSSSPASNLTSRDAIGSLEGTLPPLGLESFVTSASDLIPQSPQEGYQSQTYPNPSFAEVLSLDGAFGPHWRDWGSVPLSHILDIGSGDQFYGTSTPSPGPALRVNESLSAQSEPRLSIHAQRTHASPVTDHLYGISGGYAHRHQISPMPANRQYQYYTQQTSPQNFPGSPPTHPPNVRPIPALRITRPPPQAPGFSCQREGCDEKFTREAGLIRHYDTVHLEVDVLYTCEYRRCGKTNRRKDKMKEHCQKRHGQARGRETYSTFYYDN